MRITQCLLMSLLATATAVAAQAPGNGSEVAAIEHAERMRGQVVGSMRLSGTLVVAADGAITAYAIDRPEKIPPPVLQHVARHVSHWRVIRPEDHAGEKRFSVRVMATPQGNGDHALSLVGASITRKGKAEEDIAVVSRPRRVQYPRAYREVGVGGTVHVALKVGRDGKVQDLATEQVNLDFVGTPSEVVQARADFAAQTAAALRQWSFRMPVAGPFAGAPYVVTRVSVHYTVKPALGYGEWEYYIPGPQRAAPWIEQEGLAAIGVGEAGVPQLVGVEPRLEMLEPRR